jgi:hypothetical protein
MDDLVHHVRSIPHQRLPVMKRITHLKVESCLDAVPWRLEECVERVTPLGRAEGDRRDLLIPSNGRGLFSIVGILQLCLFGCEPFRGLTEPKVKDVRPKVPKPRERIHDCPRRPDLLDNLAGALLALPSPDLPDMTWTFFATERDRSRVFHQQVESLLMDYLRREIPLPDPILHHQSRAIIKTMRWLDDRLSHIQPAFLPPADVSFTFDSTLRVMASDFRTFTPSTFTQAAIHHALADILTTLGISNKRGNPLTAAGIKGLLRRIPAARKPRARDGDKKPEKP